MKKLLLLVTVMFAALFSFAQKRGAAASEASWKVSLGKKVLLKATGEDENANVITLRRADLKKKASFTLSYVPESGQSAGWNRTITVYGANDTELQQHKGNKLTLSNYALAQLVKGKDQVKIYTMAIPSDKRKAALVRVRRMHLVTINITD
jgi:hypothetical protein